MNGGNHWDNRCNYFFLSHYCSVHINGRIIVHIDGRIDRQTDRKKEEYTVSDTEYMVPRFTLTKLVV